MKTKCPHCGQSYEVNNDAIGTVVTCESCWKDFTVGEKPPKPKTEPKPVAPPHPAEVPVPKKTTCPYCGGEIITGVKKCRHCGEWLNDAARPKDAAAFVMLGTFFGLLGLHMFYVGNVIRGGVHLAITSMFLLSLMGTGGFRHMDFFTGAFVVILSIAFLLNIIFVLIELADCEKYVASAPSAPANTPHNQTAHK